MKQWVTLAGLGLIAALGAVLSGASRLAAPAKQTVYLPRTSRLQTERTARRRCVRLGWKAPYWYAGGVSPQRTQSTRREGI